MASTSVSTESVTATLIAQLRTVLDLTHEVAAERQTPPTVGKVVTMVDQWTAITGRQQPGGQQAVHIVPDE